MGTLTGIPRQAINSTGGLKKVYIAKVEDVTVSISAGVGTVTDSDGVTFVDSAAAKAVIKEYIPSKESSNITETWTGTVATGQGFAEQIATLVFHKFDVTKRNELMELAQSECVIIGIDWNGQSVILGAESGADITSSVNGTGTAGGDLNGFTVTLRAMEKEMMPEADSAILALLA